MKKEWQTPLMEVLEIKMTMAGPGKHYTDSFQDDPDKDEADKYS